jgi:EmrB/QacA subfamily drug resistance transporter
MTAVLRPKRKPPALDAEMRKLALVVIAGSVMTILDTTIVNVAITPLGRDFHTSLSTIQWVLTGYTLALSMAIPVTGWAVERFGAKATWTASLLIFIVGSVLSGAAWSAASLIGFRVLQGIGGGMIMPVGQTMVARRAGPERMTRLMSVVAVPMMLGPVLGPVIGGLIVDNLSWRWMFYVNVPLCVIALVLAARMLPRDDGHRDARIDVPGLALLSPGLALMVYALSRAGISNGQLAIWLPVGAALVAAFTVRALRAASPLVSVRAFARRAFGTTSAAMFIYTGAMFGFMVVLPVYFQVVRGQSPLDAGLLMAPIGIGAMITMSLSGRLADRVAARWIAIPGMLLVAAGALVFTQIHVGTSLALLGAALFVAGLGHGAILPPTMGASYQGMPRPEIPTATATFNVVLRVGSSFGTAVLAVVLQRSIQTRVPGASGGLSGTAALHGAHALAALTSAFGASFWWVAAIAAIAVLPAFLIPARPASAPSPPPAPPAPGNESATGAPPASVAG